MPSYHKLTSTEIRLGEPLPFSVYDKSGILLLKAGYSINVQRHLDILLENGLYVRPDEIASRPVAAKQERNREEANTFLILDTAKLRMQRLLEQFRRGNLREDFLKRIEDLAVTLQEACSHDTDAALANLHLDYETSYAVVHHMQAAILCEITAKRLGIKDEARLTLVKAALTHDIDLLDIQDILDRQATPLTPEQRDRIRAHPERSAKILRELGVTDETWLDAVAHHHERLDGSGYPDALSGEAVRIPTRILALSDIYSAMIRDRPYRKAMVTKEAMRQLLLEQGEKTDQRLIQMMIKEVGVFPPGAVVRLANNEVSVVKHRQESGLSPIVYSFIKSTGMPMLTPLRRETVAPEHRVEGIVPFSDYRGSIAVIRGLWVGSGA